jgi:hypothetical protein
LPRHAQDYRAIRQQKTQVAGAFPADSESLAPNTQNEDHLCRVLEEKQFHEREILTIKKMANPSKKS